MAQRRMRLFRRSEPAATPRPDLKTYGEVTVSAPLVQALQLIDGTPAGYGALYRTLAPVRTVVDFIADAVATTPIKVYRREDNGRPEVRDHPLSVLLRNPNPDLNTNRLIFRLVADLAIYGNAYWLKAVSPDGRRQLIPLPPHRVTPRGGDLMKAGFYDFFRPNGLPAARYAGTDVAHFRLYDPEDPRIGSSKLQALRPILLEEIEASKFRRGYWSNHAQLEGVLEHPSNLSDEALTRLEARWDSRYAGSNNAGVTPILEEGMTWKSTSLSAKESEFLESRKFVLEATAHVFDLPLSLLSLTETTTYASQREFHKQLYTEVLPPWYELIQGDIELQVLPWFADIEDIYTEFVADSKLRGDFIDRASVLNTSIGRPWMTVKEGRGFENLPARTESTDDELVVPVGPNLALEGMAEEMLAAQAAPEPAPQQDMATVTMLPTNRAASALWQFFDRQERSVMSRKGAGHVNVFDRARWDAELEEVLGSKALAQRVNLETEMELAVRDDPRAVFERARRERLALITQETA